jgi:hypothetical protein
MDGPHVDTLQNIRSPTCFYITPRVLPRAANSVVARAGRSPLPIAAFPQPADVVVSEAFVKMYMPGDGASRPASGSWRSGSGRRRPARDRGRGRRCPAEERLGRGRRAGGNAGHLHSRHADRRTNSCNWCIRGSRPSWTVRSAGPAEGVIAGMQRALQSVDPQLPFAGFHSMEDVRYRALAQERFSSGPVGRAGGAGATAGRGRDLRIDRQFGRRTRRASWASGWRWAPPCRKRCAPWRCLESLWRWPE